MDAVVVRLNLGPMFQPEDDIVMPAARALYVALFIKSSNM